VKSPQERDPRPQVGWLSPTKPRCFEFLASRPKHAWVQAVAAILAEVARNRVRLAEFERRQGDLAGRVPEVVESDRVLVDDAGNLPRVRHFERVDVNDARIVAHNADVVLDHPVAGESHRTQAVRLPEVGVDVDAGAGVAAAVVWGDMEHARDLVVGDEVVDDTRERRRVVSSKDPDTPAARCLEIDDFVVRDISAAPAPVGDRLIRVQEPRRTTSTGTPVPCRWDAAARC